MVPGYPELTPSSQPERLAVASLVLGIAGLLVCPLVIPSILAVILGLVARGRIRREPGKGGSGVATAGLLTGLAGLIIIPLLVTLFLPQIRDAIDEGVESVVDQEAEASLRDALAKAKALYADGSTYRNVTGERVVEGAGTGLVWSPDGESTAPNVISFLVVSDAEIRLVTRSASGRCIGLRDVASGGMPRWAALDDAPNCKASTFGAHHFVLPEPPTAT